MISWHLFLQLQLYNKYARVGPNYFQGERMQWPIEKLGFNPDDLKRELTRYYISLTKQEQLSMLQELGLNSLDELFNHIDQELKMDLATKLEDGLNYGELINYVEQLAAKNRPMTSFIGDALHYYKVPEIVPFVANLRGLTTAYTPYQPERSQGTLIGQWLYANAISAITGFEAVNASLYDRSTALFEAINTAIRIKRKSDTVLVCESIAPQDLDVVRTLAQHTSVQLKFIPLSSDGITDYAAFEQELNNNSSIAAVAFAQQSHLGFLNQVDPIVDLADKYKVSSIAVVDPLLMGHGGLIPPSEFGSQKQGATIFVAEGQQIFSTPNLGGPGLGIFGIRYNQKQKLNIRNTPGRYVGKGVDVKGNQAFCMVLSTREQHIRREKATSNICSNQAFAATLCGAALLARGAEGLEQLFSTIYQQSHQLAKKLLQFSGVELAYNRPFINQFTLKLDRNVSELIDLALKDSIELGVDVSDRFEQGNYLQIFISDTHSTKELEELENFFAKHFSSNPQEVSLPNVTRRSSKVTLKHFSTTELQQYYTQLANLNLSPDDNLYPLGSCTMKYNPYVNDYAANLEGFCLKHPQAPIENIQGSLEVLYEIQELFKKITGLPAVCTQPVAGANGELAGIKMFQAYHADHGEAEQRTIIILPRSAHGTNPATAAMAGYETKKIDGIQYGIVTVEADKQGEINFTQLQDIVNEYSNRICGIMITNPNTSGIFERRYKEIADLIHSVGGLMYMDGANMNAIAGHLDLGKMGVDAVHNNLHKTWSISHGGGGPGDAIVAVSEKLIPFIIGQQVVKEDGKFHLITPQKSVGTFHRHLGNFAHKIRALAYLKALGGEGVKQMSAIAVLSSRYLFNRLTKRYPTLPANTEQVPRMHEFILTIEEELFAKIEAAGVIRAQVIPQIGKLFLDFGIHAPTVAFPEQYGLMVEPTESFTQAELDKFAQVVEAIKNLITEYPQVLKSAPHFSPIYKMDEVAANKNLTLTEELDHLPELPQNRFSALELQSKTVEEITQMIIQAASES
jgi:glycine dehydrogenase